MLEAASVTALGENGASGNYGMQNSYAATLRGGSYIGSGGTSAYGIYNYGSGTTLEAESITALGKNGASGNYGLYNWFWAAVTLRGGSFIGRDGTDARGIYNYVGTLEADSITALGENSSSENYGLYNRDSVAATLRGGSFTGSGGTEARGIYNYNNTTLEAESVTALGENGSSKNYGLINEDSAVAMLNGGSFTGSGGSSAWGIYNSNGTTLEAKSITALGENGSLVNYGLLNEDGAAATLRGGSFTGRGGEYARGIYNDGTLEAESVTALAEGGSVNNYGLYNYDSGTTNVTQSVLEGATYSVCRDTGSVTVSNSRLVGTVSGTVTCVAVSRNFTFNANGCP